MLRSAMMTDSSRTSIRIVVKRLGLRTRSIQAYPSQYLTDAGYQVSTDKGVVFVKPFRGTRPRLMAVADAVQLLQDAHYPHAVPWLCTLDQHRWVQVKERLYYATQWLHGQRFGDDPQMYEHLGQALAALHSIPHHLVTRLHLPVRTPLTALRKADERFRSSIRSLQVQHDSALPREPSWQLWMVDHFQQCESLSDQAWDSLTVNHAVTTLSEYQRRPTLLHGDVTRPNLIATTASPHVYLLDWEQTKLGCPMTDLASAMTNTTDFRTTAMEHLLDGYEQQRPLSKGDKALLCALCQFPREAWYLSRGINRPLPPQGFEALVARWDDRIAAIEWLRHRLNG